MQGKVDRTNDIEKEAVVYFSIILVMIVGFFHYLQDKASYDIDKVGSKREKSEPKS